VGGKPLKVAGNGWLRMVSVGFALKQMVLFRLEQKNSKNVQK